MQSVGDTTGAVFHFMKTDMRESRPVVVMVKSHFQNTDGSRLQSEMETGAALHRFDRLVVACTTPVFSVA